ncbi:MAG: hypothetical protein IIA67_03440 [Planctomycetes bacterium]|nr:hypothetical protein [Planctomycetota bacterium]
MCLLILQFKTCCEAPVLLAANREEYFERRSTPPRLHAGTPPIVLREEHRGTVSSSLVALADDPRRCVYLYADGAPDRTSYGDYSELLRRALDER